ncbi:diguanylate cyclase domain-containing protein [Rhodococcus aerolatus]
MTREPDDAGTTARAARAALDAAGEQLAVGLVVDGRWVLATAAVADLLGADPVEQPGRVGDGGPDLRPHLDGVLATGLAAVDVDLTGADGRRWRTAFRPTDVDGAPAVAVAATDVTRLVETVAELRHDVAHDPLTGLLNRRELVDRLSAALARRDRGVVGVVFADIDGFKLVNDRLGHRVGDAVLVAVARRLQAVVRSNDILGRLGGDEFVLVREDAGGDADLAGLVDRLGSALALPVVVDGHRVPVTLSLGLAVAAAGQDALQTLEVADLAMYEGRRRPARAVAPAGSPRLSPVPASPS